MFDGTEDGDKNDTYYCSWRKTDKGKFVGWEVRRPSLRAEADSGNELMSALGDVIGQHYNDFEAALSFDPPLDDIAQYADLFVDEFVTLRWNAWYRYRPTINTAFDVGRCSACGGGRGDRSPTALVTDEFTGDTDGAFAWSMFDPTTASMPGNLMIVSEKFLANLFEDERSTFAARRVEWADKRRLKFVEIIPKSILPCVAIRGLKVSGWRCDQCGRRSFSHGDLGWGVNVITRTALRESNRSFFFVGTPLDFSTCVPLSRWRELHSKPATRKMIYERLAVVDDDRADPQPVLQVPDLSRESNRR